MEQTLSLQSDNLIYYIITHWQLQLKPEGGRKVLVSPALVCSKIAVGEAKRSLRA